MNCALCPFPPALFDAICILKKPDKAQLAKAIDKHVSFLSDDAVTDNVSITECCVLERESLIHRLHWQRGSTYGAIADAYKAFYCEIMEKQRLFLMATKTHRP